MEYPAELSITPSDSSDISGPELGASPDGADRDGNLFIDIMELTLFDTSLSGTRDQGGSPSESNSSPPHSPDAKNTPHPAFSDFFEYILTGNVGALTGLLEDKSVDIDLDAPLDLDYIREDSPLWTADTWLRYADHYWEEMSRGCTGLYLAAYRNHPQIVQVLLQHGADPEKIVDTKAESALHIACKYGHVEVVRVLLAHGVDPDIRDCICDGQGNTALIMTAACYNPGIYYSERNKPGVYYSQQDKPEVHYSQQDKADPGDEGDLDEKYLTISGMLIEAGADVNACDEANISPLHLAATKSDTRLTEMLINAGADLNARSLHASTPLARAVRRESYDNLCLILAAGCEVNQNVWPGTTALGVAMEQNYLEAVLVLLSWGADLTAATSGSVSQELEATVTGRHLVVIWLLLAHGLDPDLSFGMSRSTLLLRLTRAESHAGVRLLLRYGASVDCENRLGTSALWAAVNQNNLTLMTLFLQHNCSLSLPSLEYQILRPLVPVQLAIEKGHFTAAKLLLQCGSPLRAGWTVVTGRNVSRPLCADREMQGWLREWQASPRSLQHYCVVRTRQVLGLGIKGKLKSIPNYPQKLKLYILKPWL